MDNLDVIGKILNVLWLPLAAALGWLTRQLKAARDKADMAQTAADTANNHADAAWARVMEVDQRTDKLYDQIKGLSERLNNLHVIVSRDYVTREELHKDMSEIKQMLVRALDMLDRKADK